MVEKLETPIPISRARETKNKTYQWRIEEGEWFQVRGVDGGGADWINVETPFETTVVIGRGKIHSSRNCGRFGKYGEGVITAIEGPQDTFVYDGHFVMEMNQARIVFHKENENRH